MPGRSRARDDDASSATISLLIATFVFAASFTVLMDFQGDPTGDGKPEHALLRNHAEGVLAVLGESAGYPRDWDGDVPGMQRPGLLAHGTERVLDPGKFAAIAFGGLTDSGRPGVVDYPRLRDALALDGDAEQYEFHVRARPLMRADATSAFGVTGMTDYRVAYLGGHVEKTDADGNTYYAPSDAAAFESGILQDFPVAFVNATYPDESTDPDAAARVADRYRDEGPYLKRGLAPRLGGVAWQEDVGGGKLPDHRFRRMNATRLTDHGVDVPPTGGHALALGPVTGRPGYAPDLDVRAHVGHVDVSTLRDMRTPAVTITEIVQGEGDGGAPGDYGVLQVYRADKGWCTLDDGVAHSRTGPAPGSGHPASWRSRTIGFDGCEAHVESAAPDDAHLVLALRWRSDGDAPGNALGWLVDAVHVEDLSARGDGLDVTFASPYYSALLVGSNVDQNALTSETVKAALRDYVFQGGHLFIMDGQENTRWMERLLADGDPTTESAFPADTRHPLLHAPNRLDHDAYAWQTPRTLQDADTDLFTIPVDAEGPSEPVLAVSDPRAFGDGLVILTAYTPADLGDVGDTEARKFIANNLVYGRYNSLYMDVGPDVPQGVPVASASMTSLMDRSRAGSGDYVGMELVVYVWKG